MVWLLVNGINSTTYALGSTSVLACGCDRGARPENGECVSCTEGMSCKGMDDVTVEAGYFAEEDLSIYKCHGDVERCPGGLPGQTCAEGRTGITCAECKDGMTPASGGACKDCGGSDSGPFIVVCIIVFLGLVFAYHLIDTQNRVTQSHALLLCAIAFGQLITATQQLGVVGMLSVEWEEPVRSFMRILGLLTFNIEVLRLNCVSTVDPVTRYTMKISIIFITIACMLLIHCTFVLLKYGGRFKDRMPSMIGSIGTLFMVFYISVTSTVIEPLQCQEHPNDSWTIASYQGIRCWDSDEHNTMLIFGGFAFFAVPVAYLVACIYVVRQFPARMRAADAGFLKAFSFLFFRFRAAQHSYVLLQMLRSFCVSVALAIPEVVIQVLFLEAVLLIGFAATLHTLPWRVAYANWLDCLFGGSTLLVVCLASLYINDEDKNLRSVAYVCICMIIAVLVLVPVAIGWGLYLRYFRMNKPYEFFLCHHKAGAGAFTRLLKMHFKESKKLTTDVFVDSDNLQNLDNLFDYVGNDTNTLTIIGTSEIFTRPWCVGEMCTARLKRVNTVVVAMPSFVKPDEQFIDEFERRIQNLEVLIENGMNLEMLETTLHWVAEIPPIWMPPMLSTPVLDGLVGILFAQKTGQQGTVPPSITDPESVAGAQCVFVFDRKNPEAAASSMVLQKMLVPLLATDAARIPVLLEQATLPLHTTNALFMCTNGCFDKIDYLTIIVQVQKQHPRITSMLPVMAEATFHIPSKDRLKEWEKQAPIGIPDTDGQRLAQGTLALFKEIAATFQPHHAAEVILHVNATDIARRLQGNMMPSKSSMKKVGSDAGSPVTRKQSNSSQAFAIKPTMSAATSMTSCSNPGKLEQAGASSNLTVDSSGTPPFLFSLEL